MVQMEPGVTRGKGRHENVDVGLHWGSFGDLIIHHFQHLFIEDSYGMNVHFIVI